MNNKQLALIHVAKKELGLDDEAYRATLLAHGGADSARDLDQDGFKAVMEHFEGAGQPEGERIRRLGLPDAFVPQATREQQLADAGLDAQGIAQAVRAFVEQGAPHPVR